jgi:uncharacterized protein (TIGR04255 family)
MTTLPAKITPDAIQEAILEIRFEHDELPMVVPGKLSSAPQWASASTSKLPGADIPDQLRALDANLRAMPSLELRIDTTELVRVGTNSISYHNIGDYLGWTNFRPRLLGMASALFTAIPRAQITRLGLRYINVLKLDQHHVGSLYDLNLDIKVDDRQPSSQIQLVYQLEPNSDVGGLVRIMSPNFVEGNPPQGAVALIDIDIYSSNECSVRTIEDIERWLEIAHNAEKSAFFRLLKPETVSRLQEA